MAQKSEMQNQQNLHMNDLWSWYYCICTVKNTLTTGSAIIFNSTTENAPFASGDFSQHRDRSYELPMNSCQPLHQSFSIRN